MADFDHLPLVRLPRVQPHRKTGNIPPPPPRERQIHAASVANQVAITLAEEARRQRIAGVDPSLILRVEMSQQTAEDEWRRAGFQVLAQDAKRLLVLFTSDAELVEFKTRLERYRNGPLTEKGNPPHNALFANIEAISAIPPEDRLGPRLRRAGVTNVAKIDGRRKWVLDIEIWDTESILQRNIRLQKIEQFIAAERGAVLSRYTGETGLIVLRARVSGVLLRKLCRVAEIACLDLPPRPDLELPSLSKITIGNAGAIVPPAADAPAIGIIDSGTNQHPLLDQALVESLASPRDWAELMCSDTERGWPVLLYTAILPRELVSNRSRHHFAYSVRKLSIVAVVSMM